MTASAADALAAAIEHAIRTDVEHEWVVTEWVVLVAAQRWDDDGELLTLLTRLVADDAPPIHRQMGLVEYHRMRLQVLATTEDGDE
jgi:hypothetical protein